MSLGSLLETFGIYDELLGLSVPNSDPRRYAFLFRRLLSLRSFNGLCLAFLCLGSALLLFGRLNLWQARCQDLAALRHFDVDAPLLGRRGGLLCLLAIAGPLSRIILALLGFLWSALGRRFVLRRSSGTLDVVVRPASDVGRPRSWRRLDGRVVLDALAVVVRYSP